MSFDGSRWGGRHKTRRAKVMSDGRVPTQDTKLELGVVWAIKSIGYFPETLDAKGKRLTVRIPAEWTEGKYDHDIILEPDCVVNMVMLGMKKVVASDGWATHGRTLGQQRRDARHDKWYVRAGYYVVHVGDNWFESESKKFQLLPELAAALTSKEKVVNLAG